jgi:DNA repair protein SbcD/Mre11
MKIAITADLHLDPSYPERAHALGDILDQIQKDGISDLIIAGDLFDRDGDSSAYDSFRELCRKYSSIRLHVVPGNHDPEKSLQHIDEENLLRYFKTELQNFDGFSILFIPYQKGLSMSEELLANHEKISGNSWGFVGHGDFIDGRRELNPLEKGVYMPLKRGDLGLPGLRRVFLGHIHKHTNPAEPLAGKVSYPGSPQGLDVSESGLRHFIVYDTQSDELFARKVNGSKYFLDETIFVFPDDRENEILVEEFNNRIKQSKIPLEELKDKARIRIKIKGYASDIESMKESFRKVFTQIGIEPYDKRTPNFDELFAATDTKKEKLTQKVLEKINHCDWNFGGDEPSLAEVKMATMRFIYKE